MRSRAVARRDAVRRVLPAAAPHAGTRSPRPRSAGPLDGPITLRAKADIVIGRPAGDESRKVLIDLKSGAVTHRHREDLRYYALVETLAAGGAAPARRVVLARGRRRRRRDGRRGDAALVAAAHARRHRADDRAHRRAPPAAAAAERRLLPVPATSPTVDDDAPALPTHGALDAAWRSHEAGERRSAD